MHVEKSNIFILVFAFFFRYGAELPEMFHSCVLRGGGATPPNQRGFTNFYLSVCSIVEMTEKNEGACDGRFFVLILSNRD